MTVAIKQMKNVGLMRRYWATLGGSTPTPSTAPHGPCQRLCRSTAASASGTPSAASSRLSRAASATWTRREFEAFYELAMAYIWKTWGIDVEKMDQQNVNLMRDEGL